MPELPEVETMCRGIAAVVGSRIRGVRQPTSRLKSIQIRPRLSEFRRRIVGKKIVSVGRVGKRVALELDTGDSIVLEPRMTGLVVLGDPPESEHVRLVFELSGAAVPRFLFWDRRGLGVARLVSARQFARLYCPEQLGPDALQVTPEILRERSQRSRRPIKVALMDQHALAGIGNLYASEILHRAALHPALPCGQLRPADWLRLHRAMREVLDEAIRQQGSTLRDGTYRAARNQPGAYQLSHRVYQRAGQQCLQCGKAAIVRIVQAQRSTFFCPRCQRS